MAKAFGIIPPEPPRIASLDLCAPKFREAVEQLTAKLESLGYPPLVYETTRTELRQYWLFGFGRGYDDGRGEVTRAPTAKRSWHFYGLAADIIHAHRYWKAPDFFEHMRELLPEFGLDFCSPGDLPHVQWGRCRKTPSAKSASLYHLGGNPLVWEAVEAK